MRYFPELYSHSQNKINVELDLPYSVTKSDLKMTAGIDTSKPAKKADLVTFKLDVDKLDFDKLKATSVDLSKLINVVKNDVVQKKNNNGIQAIDTSELVLKKTDYDAKIKDIDDKTPNHDKYIVTNDFNKFLGTIFHKRLKETKLRTK